MKSPEAILLVKQPVAEQATGGSGGATNTANQGIDQAQSNLQTAQCVTGGDLNASCNNTSTQGQVNIGSNTAGQTAGEQVQALVAELTLQIRAYQQQHYSTKCTMCGRRFIRKFM